MRPHLLSVKTPEAAAVQFPLIVDSSDTLPYNCSSIIALQYANKPIDNLLIMVETSTLQQMHSSVQDQCTVLIHIRARNNVLQLEKDSGNVYGFPSEHQVHFVFSSLC